MKYLYVFFVFNIIVCIGIYIINALKFIKVYSKKNVLKNKL